MPIAISSVSADNSMPPTPERQLWLVDATAAARAVTLPDATTCFGVEITVIKSDSSANAVAVNRAGSQTILGTGGASLTTFSLTAQGKSVTMISTGTGWIIQSNT